MHLLIIKIWELESRKCIKTLFGHKSSVACIKNVFNDKLISGDKSGLVKIWKIESGECIKTINAHSLTIRKVILISNNGFATCSDDK